MIDRALGTLGLAGSQIRDGADRGLGKAFGVALWLQAAALRRVIGQRRPGEVLGLGEGSQTGASRVSQRESGLRATPWVDR